MATNYSRHIFKELEKANIEIEELKNFVIPKLKKEYEAKIYDVKATAAENLSNLRKEKDSEIASLKLTIAELKTKVSAAENEIVRLKNIMNKDSTNSSNPPSTDEVWERKEKKKRKSANEYSSRRPSEKNRGGQKGHKGKCLTKEDVRKLLDEHADEINHVIVDVGKNELNCDCEPKVKYELDMETCLPTGRCG